MIIDAFGELRDQLESVKEDMESNCFICGIGKDYFDKVPHGFDTHVQQEHNLANYMWVVEFYYSYVSLANNKSYETLHGFYRLMKLKNIPTNENKITGKNKLTELVRC